MSAWIAASLLALTAVAHSALGELGIIAPLLRDKRWDVGLPRWAVDRILRFAWHLTSVAWLALGAALVGVEIGIAFGAFGLASAVGVFFTLRAHLAWPLFLAMGLYALDHADALPTFVPQGLAWAAIAVAIAAAAVHVRWAVRGDLASLHVLPERAGTEQPIATPHPALTAAVAAVLAGFAGLTWWTAFGNGAAWAWWLTAVAALVLVLRAYAAGRYAGFFKTVYGTPFARRDDALYTPVVVLLAAGAISALHLAGSPL